MPDSVHDPGRFWRGRFWLWATSAIAISAIAISACDRHDPDIRVADLVIRLPRVEDCRPTEEATSIVVQALGDFPPSDENTIDVLRPSPEPQLIERFPIGTEIIGVQVTAGMWTGIGARILGGESVMGPLLLVPEGRVCPLVAFGELLEGAQVIALANGGLLLIGGLDDAGIATTRIVRVDPGEREGVVLPPEHAMRLERVGHQVIDLGDRVMILGGALSLSDTALNEWEMYDVSRGGVVEQGQMLRRRIHHAAVRLADGRVLVVGGREQATGDALASAELMDLDGRSREVGAVPIARSQHKMVTLDDGTTVLVGGFGDDDAFLPRPVVWDPATETLVRQDDSSLAVGLWREGFQLVPLEGGRVVVLGDAYGSQHTGEAVILRHDGFGPRLALDELPLAIPDLTTVRALEIDDGRLLVTGRDGLGNPRAFAFQIGTSNEAGETLGEELDPPPRVPEELVKLRDGLVLELAPNGASARRVGSLRTALHNARATILGPDLSLDSSASWSQDRGDLVALRVGARADIPTLRFADVSIHVDVSVGDDNRGVEVLLRPDQGLPVSVLIRRASAGPALCEATRAPNASVTIERRDGKLHIDAGDILRTCTVEGLGDRIAVGFRSRDTGARLSGLSVNRL